MNTIAILFLLIAAAIRPDCDILGTDSDRPSRGRQQPAVAVQPFDVAAAIQRSINQQNPQAAQAQQQQQQGNVQQTIRIRQGGLFGGRGGK